MKIIISKTEKNQVKTYVDIGANFLYRCSVHGVYYVISDPIKRENFNFEVIEEIEFDPSTVVFYYYGFFHQTNAGNTLKFLADKGHKIVVPTRDELLSPSKDQSKLKKITYQGVSAKVAVAQWVSLGQ